jgi:RNA polymerase sigma-70 factor (ECF subfamily)
VKQVRTEVSSRTGSRRSCGKEALHPHDRDAAVRFVDQYYRKIYSFFWWLAGNRAHAADLTQDVFAAFWDSLARTKVRDQKSWLYQIARNRWRKHCRERHRGDRELQHGSDSADCSSNPADLVAEAESDTQVGAAVRRLPAVYREVVILRYWHDLSHKEIATIQGVPVALSRWRLFRGRSLLRELLSEGAAATGTDTDD